MSRESDAWRQRIAEARAEGHAAGVAEGRRMERTDTIAWLQQLECLSRSMVTAFRPGPMRACYEVLATAYGAGSLYVARGGHVGRASEDGATDAPPVAPEAPTGATVTRDVAAPAEGTARVQDERRRGGGA